MDIHRLVLLLDSVRKRLRELQELYILMKDHPVSVITILVLKWRYLSYFKFLKFKTTFLSNLILSISSSNLCMGKLLVLTIIV